MTYGGCKDLPGRATSNKVLYDKTFYIAVKPKYVNVNINVDFLQWFINVLIKTLLIVLLLKPAAFGLSFWT